MSIRNDIREAEKYLQSISEDEAEQMEIVSKAQSIAANDETTLVSLGIIKNRLIHRMQKEMETK